MSSHGSNEFRASVTPLDISLAGAIVAYLLSAAVMRDFLSPEAAATLVRFPAVAFASVSVIAVYAGLWFYLSPRTVAPGPREHEDIQAIVVETIASNNRFRESFAAASRWWHHLLGATAGFTFGLFLSCSIVWLST